MIKGAVSGQWRTIRKHNTDRGESASNTGNFWSATVVAISVYLERLCWVAGTIMNKVKNM